MIRVTSLLLIFLASTLFATPLHKSTDDTFKLIILHNNDMHARFEQTNAASGRCKEDDEQNNRCYGGFARVAHEVRKYKKKAEDGEIPPVLYLNAGDTYTGTPWFTIFKDNITAAFLNILKPDAMSLGNHEFDLGSENLGKFLDEIKIPVLAANLVLDNEPSLQGKPILMPSYVFTMEDGIKIGVIGYLTPETKGLAIPNEVEFTDEIEAINKEATRLKEQGIKIIIALGHSGIERDKHIAHDCPDIDLVIGGHSHTFLYTGLPPDNDQPEDIYPVKITQPNGRVVPVVQSYAYTKYLGFISMEFDDEGEMIFIDGSPILLNASIERENDILELLELYRPAVLALQNEIVGYTRVDLDGSCRRKECNLGNFIADSMIEWNALKYGGEGWTDAAIAFIQGGGIRTSITKEGNGTITKEDIQTVMPFESKIVVIEITGEVLLQAMETSVHRYNDGEAYGEFLQYSGVLIEYDMNNEPGKRIVNARVVCAYCAVPELEPIDLAKKYRVVVQDFLEGGGDGYSMLEGTKVKESEDIDIDIMAAYLKKKSPIYPAIEWRITINELKIPKDEIVGSTKVYLDGNCHRGECNLGNFIADSIVDQYAVKYQQVTGWTDASIAIIQASNIRHSIDNSLNDGQITLQDAQDILPNQNQIVLVDVKGVVLRQALEHAVARYSDEVHLSEFLQMSGMQVEFDMNNAVNSRVNSIKILCSLCTLPEWENFNETLNYKILMPESLAHGAEGFTMFEEFIEDYAVFNELEAFLSYLKKKSPIYPALEWRITIKRSIDPTEDVIGKTRVILDNDCQNSECNLGNFITDSMVDWYSEKYNNSNYWTDAAIAMFQGSRIGVTIDPNHTNGSIFRSDVIQIFQPTPYDLHVVTLRGKHLHDILEYSIAKYEDNKNDENFLQLSGIQVTYDLNKPPGSRIVDLKIRCAECSKPQLDALDIDKTYKVIMQSVMLTEDYRDVMSTSVDVNLNETDINVFLHYVKKKSPIYPAIEERIKLLPKSETTPKPSTATKTKFSTVVILIALMTYFH